MNKLITVSLCVIDWVKQAYGDRGVYCSALEPNSVLHIMLNIYIKQYPLSLITAMSQTHDWKQWITVCSLHEHSSHWPQSDCPLQAPHKGLNHRPNPAGVRTHCVSHQRSRPRLD